MQLLVILYIDIFSGAWYNPNVYSGSRREKDGTEDSYDQEKVHP